MLCRSTSEENVVEGQRNSISVNLVSFDDLKPHWVRSRIKSCVKKSVKQTNRNILFPVRLRFKHSSPELWHRFAWYFTSFSSVKTSVIRVWCRNMTSENAHRQHQSVLICRKINMIFSPRAYHLRPAGRLLLLWYSYSFISANHFLHTKMADCNWSPYRELNSRPRTWEANALSSISIGESRQMCCAENLGKKVYKQTSKNHRLSNYNYNVSTLQNQKSSSCDTKILT